MIVLKDDPRHCMLEHSHAFIRVDERLTITNLKFLATAAVYLQTLIVCSAIY